MRRWALPEADSYFAPLMDERGFQVEHLDAALKYVTGWRVAVDGGAHVGTWACEMAARFGCVLAFEPAADTFECLMENMRGLSNVSPVRAALGVSHGYGRMVDDLTRPGNTGARWLDACGVGDVVVIALDDMTFAGLDLLKLDLEGGELAALRGAEQTLRRYRPVVVMEVKRLGAGRPDPTLAVWQLSEYGYAEVDRRGNDRIFVAR